MLFSSAYLHRSFFCFQSPESIPLTFRKYLEFIIFCLVICQLMPTEADDMSPVWSITLGNAQTGMASTAACECGTKEQTTKPIITSCPIYHHPNRSRVFSHLLPSVSISPKRRKKIFYAIFLSQMFFTSTKNALYSNT